MPTNNYSRSDAARSLLEHLSSASREPLTHEETKLLFDLYQEGKELPNNPDAVIAMLRSELGRS